MNAREWHWARLKKDLKICPSNFFTLDKRDPFTVPEDTIVRARFYMSPREPIIELVIGDLIMTTHDTQYSDLLEPLE